MNPTELKIAEDCLYPSDNEYDIPCLRLDRQAGHLLLPFSPYGAGRKTKEAQTIHFYVDDYRFAALWKNPAKLLNSRIRAIVEPNYSLFDTTPIAQGLELIYKKRWLARFFQECGITPDGSKNSAENIRSCLRHARDKKAQTTVIYQKYGKHSRKDIEDGIRLYEEKSKHRFKQIFIVTKDGRIHRHTHNDLQKKRRLMPPKITRITDLANLLGCLQCLSHA